MGNWDFKTTPGWHWESVKLPSGRVRFRVKDDWIDESVCKRYAGLLLLASEETRSQSLAKRSFSDADSNHYLYIAEVSLSRDATHMKILNKLSTAVGYENAVFLVQSPPADYGCIQYEVRPDGVVSFFCSYLLSKDYKFAESMPVGGQTLATQLNKTLFYPAESWKFHFLVRNDEVLTYSFYIGPGTQQEMNGYSPFWGMDSNTGSNYFFNSIEV